MYAQQYNDREAVVRAAQLQEKIRKLRRIWKQLCYFGLLEVLSRTGCLFKLKGSNASNEGIDKECQTRKGRLIIQTHTEKRQKYRTCR